MERKSLDEINGSVDVPNVYQSAFWQKFLAYSGPGALVSVGYMDPGNWLTSLAGGSQYRYQLLVVLFTAILIAMYMQSLAIKLGVTTRTDLAQAIAQRLPAPLRIALWLQTIGLLRSVETWQSVKRSAGQIITSFARWYQKWQKYCLSAIA